MCWVAPAGRISCSHFTTTTRLARECWPESPNTAVSPPKTCRRPARPPICSLQRCMDDPTMDDSTMYDASPRLAADQGLGRYCTLQTGDWSLAAKPRWLEACGFSHVLILGTSWPASGRRGYGQSAMRECRVVGRIGPLARASGRARSRISAGPARKLRVHLSPVATSAQANPRSCACLRCLLELQAEPANRWICSR